MLKEMVTSKLFHYQIAASYHSGSVMIWLDGVSCPTPDIPLLQCGHSGLGDTNCSHHSEDVALECDT